MEWLELIIAILSGIAFTSSCLAFRLTPIPRTNPLKFYWGKIKSFSKRKKLGQTRCYCVQFYG